MVPQVAKIVELVTRWSASDERRLTPQLRRSKRIRTIQASLAIEISTMSRCRLDNGRRMKYSGKICRHWLFFYLQEVMGYSVQLLIIVVITMRITDTNDLLPILNLLLACIGVRGGGAF